MLGFRVLVWREQGEGKSGWASWDLLPGQGYPLWDGKAADGETRTQCLAGLCGTSGFVMCARWDLHEEDEEREVEIWEAVKFGIAQRSTVEIFEQWDGLLVNIELKQFWGPGWRTITVHLWSQYHHSSVSHRNHTLWRMLSIKSARRYGSVVCSEQCQDMNWPGEPNLTTNDAHPITGVGNKFVSEQNQAFSVSSIP